MGAWVQLIPPVSVGAAAGGVFRRGGEGMGSTPPVAQSPQTRLGVHEADPGLIKEGKKSKAALGKEVSQSRDSGRGHPASPPAASHGR